LFLGRLLTILDGQRFNKKYKIFRTSDYRRIYQNGKKITTGDLVICYLPNNLVYSRLGISISKSVGNAVERNKRKRWIKEIFRTSSIIRKKGLDIVIVLQNNEKELYFIKLKEQLEKAIQNI
jgi:ribonuclease P protein component